jgi:cytochrome b561
MWKNSTERFGSVSIALHWLMLLLMVAAYATIELREFYPKGSDPREALKVWHFMLGLSIFGLVWLRLLMRIIAPTPRIVPAQKPLEALLAKLMHGALYLLMIGVPLVGWLLLSAAGKPIPFFGLELPPLIGESKEVAGQLKELHETAGEVGYFLIALHAAAALFHHYVKRDNTLLMMLPERHSKK